MITISNVYIKLKASKFNIKMFHTGVNTVGCCCPSLLYNFTLLSSRGKPCIQTAPHKTFLFQPTWSRRTSSSSIHLTSSFLFLSWSMMPRFGSFTDDRDSAFLISSSVLYLTLLSLWLRTKERFFWTNPLVPEPRTVVRPMPLYMVAAF